MCNFAQVKGAVCHFSCGRAENRHSPVVLAPDSMGLWVIEVLKQLLKIFCKNHVEFQSLLKDMRKDMNLFLKYIFS